MAQVDVHQPQARVLVPLIPLPPSPLKGGGFAGRLSTVSVPPIGLFRVFIFWYHERRFAATIGRDTTMNVIQALTTIPDPRRRRGRQYPLFGLLAIVLLAAMHGERS